jgi:hypothetical protein
MKFKEIKKEENGQKKVKGDNSKMASETVTRKRKANENNIVANKRNKVKVDIKRGNNKVVPEKNENQKFKH